MILCFGATPVFQRTMVFERLVLGEVNRAREVYDYASGKSVNVARVVRELHADVLASGFLGGTRGELLRQDLDRSGIRHDFITVAPQTRQCITVIDQAAGAATELVEESSPVADDDWRRLDEKLRMLLPQARVWVFSGTLPPGAPQDFYARWLPMAQRIGAIAIVDARGEPLRLAMRHANPILKVNRQELASTLGQDLGEDGALTAAMRQHVPDEGQIVVTAGAQGAFACDRQRCWRVRVPEVPTISAIGSGDAFAAGMAVALMEGRGFNEALRLGAACGAANAMTPLAGHVNRRDVDRLLDQVRVEEV